MDDTLLENDRIEDLRAWQRYRVERLNNTHLLSMSWYRADYLFDHPYRGTLDVLSRFRAWGPTTRMRSDGDIVFRPRPLGRFGISEATGGHVLSYVHRKKRRYPADYRVKVEDKLGILTAMKKAWGEHGTTMFPCQEKFASERPAVLASIRPPDIPSRASPTYWSMTCPACSRANDRSRQRRR